MKFGGLGVLIVALSAAAAWLLNRLPSPFQRIAFALAILVSVAGAVLAWQAM